MMPERTLTIESIKRAPAGACEFDANHVSERVALAARGLSYLRGRRSVLHDINLGVAAGEIVALAGSNGSGKTTLLECLAGALRPAAGQVLWFGESARSPATRRLVGYLRHESGLYLTLTVLENLLFAGHMCGLDRVADRAAELLSVTGLGRHTRQLAARLSRGMRQRLAIARAVIHDPPILLLDEPFTSLDAVGRDWLVQFLRDLRNRQRSILLVAHFDEMNRGMADRLFCLSQCRLAPANLYAKGA